MNEVEHALVERIQRLERVVVTLTAWLASDKAGSVISRQDSERLVQMLLPSRTQHYSPTTTE
jgi:hypothetical protein